MIDALYSTRILTLAANMPRTGRLAQPHGSAERASKLCGSTAIVDVRLDDQGRVIDFAQTVKACALGQATAAIVGAQVIGADLGEIDAARQALFDMLKSGGPPPQGRFGDLAVLDGVRAFPARHASTLLPLEATAEAVRQALERTRLAGAA